MTTPRPPAKAPSRAELFALAQAPVVRMERLGVQRTFRFKESLDRSLQDGAALEAVSFSEYVRRCVVKGHIVKDAERRERQASA
jgi:hypothetical protein